MRISASVAVMIVHSPLTRPSPFAESISRAAITFTSWVSTFVAILPAERQGELGSKQPILHAHIESLARLDHRQILLALGQHRQRRGQAYAPLAIASMPDRISKIAGVSTCIP